MTEKIKVGDTVRLRWGKRTAVVFELPNRVHVRLDRQLQGATLWSPNDLVVVKREKEQE